MSQCSSGCSCSRCCKKGKRGVTGSTGATGPAGFTGSTGATGGGEGASYISAFIFATGIADGDPIPFDGSGVVPVGIANAGGVFTIADAGIYEVSVSVSFTSSVTPSIVLFGAFQDGVARPEPDFYANQETADESTTVGGSFIVSAAAGDTLEIRNKTGDIVFINNAYLTINRIE